MIIFLLPVLLFSKIIFENLKPFYYQNQIINLNAKVLLPTPDNLHITSSNVETKLKKINPYLYELNLTFKNDKSLHQLIIQGKNFYKEVNLTNLFKTKNFSYKPENFCNVSAKELNISNAIATLNKTHIILSFLIKCKQCNLEDFNLSNNQKLSIIKPGYASYYIEIPNTNFYFYYFNLDRKTFEKIKVPVILHQNTISTQTNISPKKNTIFTPFNILLLIGVAFGLLVFLIYQRVYLLILPILFLVPFITNILPKGKVTIKANSNIYLLPIPQSTIIYKTPFKEDGIILNKTKNYIKVKVKNKIGWVKIEDTY